MSESDREQVFEFCALCGDSLDSTLDVTGGVCQACIDATADSGAQHEMLPHEVYAEEADYVKLAFKTMTAQRMVGWLRAFADYCEFAGNTTTATHVRRVANRLAAEVEPESVRVQNPQDGEGE